MNRFLIWADQRHFISVRALTLYVALVMTWQVVDWATNFAYAVATTDKSGVEMAAIIAAVTAPVSALQAFVFKWYMEAKRD